MVINLELTCKKLDFSIILILAIQSPVAKNLLTPALSAYFFIQNKKNMSELKQFYTISDQLGSIGLCEAKLVPNFDFQEKN